jgi:hypothetical protein
MKNLMKVPWLDCRGYAVREVRVLQIQDNQLFVDYSMENVGTRPVWVDEYVHNYIM